MPSAATIANNESKEKRASVSSIGASSSSGGGVGVVGNSNGQHSSSNFNLAESAKTVLTSTGSQTDLSNNNNINGGNGVGPAIGVSSKALKASSAVEPYKQILVTIDHKIRNLEKRKTKLESYRAIQSNGKELSADQAAAVAKYDAVISTLDFARDLSKQMQQLCKDADKEQKKQARRDNQAKLVAEAAKIREVLTIQNVLSCFADENVRNDFASGENGAKKLEDSDIDVLQKFYTETQIRRPETADDVSFNTSVQKATDLYAMTINARAKPYGDITFEKLRLIFQQIQECGYLDKYYMQSVVAGMTTVANSTDSSGTGINVGSQILQNDTDKDPSDLSALNSIEDGLDKLNLALSDCSGGNVLSEFSPHQKAVDRSILVLDQQRGGAMEQPLLVTPAGGQPPLQQQSVGENSTPVHVLYNPSPSQPPPHVPPQLVAAGGAGPSPQSHQLLNSPVNLQTAQPGPTPTTVRAVEQGYFKQQPTTAVLPVHHAQQQTGSSKPQQQQPFIQQLRPLVDMLGPGNFHFLQDSELDTSELGPPLLPSQPPQQQKLIHGLVYEGASHGTNVEPTIQTLTFTNQSFPSLLQQQQQQLPPPKQAPQQQQQHFSPVSGPASMLLQQEQRQQQSQQPMLIMAHMGPPPPQQQQQPPKTIGMQAGDVTVAFPYDSAVVTYEQQLQQQLGLKQQLQAPALSGNDPVQEQQKQSHLPSAMQQSKVAGSSVSGGKSSTSGDADNNEWHVNANDTNAVATAALTTVLKTNSSALTSIEPTVNKWSSEINAISNNKSEWQARDVSGGGGNSTLVDDSPSNHWNVGQPDNGANGRRNSGNYQHRRNAGGGDERRGGDERGRSGGSYRSRNYANSSNQQQNGRNNNAGGVGTNSVYFRNNDATGATNSTGNSYYQNGGGGGVYTNKESRYESSSGGGGGGSAYRGSRSGNQRNTNGPFGRPMGDRGGRNPNGPAGNGGPGYMNTRQSSQQQRMSLGLENKN